MVHSDRSRRPSLPEAARRPIRVEKGRKMRLIVQRSQADKKGMLGGHKGVEFSLYSKVEFDDEERKLLDHYMMWSYSLFSRGQLPITIRNLADGDSQTVGNVEILLSNENIVKQSLDKVPALLDVLRSFGGREVIEYPRATDLDD